MVSPGLEQGSVTQVLELNVHRRRVLWEASRPNRIAGSGIQLGSNLPMALPQVAGDGTLCKRRALSLYYHSSDAAIMPY